MSDAPILPEHAEEVAARVPALVLIVLPDPDAQVPLDAPLLGRPPVARLAEAALEAGFDHVYLAPGTCGTSGSGIERATGEPVGGAAVVAYESAFLDPDLLRLMVRHPLDLDERFSIYDRAGRPAAWFAGHVPKVPSHMPISEELDLPPEIGPDRIARFVYPEDRERVEALVLACEGVPAVQGAVWYRRLATWSLRGLTASGRPVEQLELLGLMGALGAGALAVVPLHVGLAVAMLSLVVAVHVSGLLPVVRVLRSDPPAEDGLAAAVRPLAHAAATAGLTYRLIAETDRSSVAALAVLALGAGSVVLSLTQARHALQKREGYAFALPDSEALAHRLGLVLPRWCAGPPLLEVGCAALALTSVPEFPWALLVAGGLARLWRWFARPPAGPATPVKPRHPT